MLGSLSLLSLSSETAIAASRWIGRGDEMQLQEQAESTLHNALKKARSEGTICVGDQELLADGLQLGNNAKPYWAVRPIEGVTATALGGTNALSLVAMSDTPFINLPPIYMDKVVVPNWAAGRVDLGAPTATLIAELARCKKVAVDELKLVVLDRPRNRALIEEIREIGARVALVPDGDVSLSISILSGRSPWDALLGSGGAREAIFTATAAKAVPDSFFGKALIRTRDEEKSVSAHPIAKLLQNGLRSNDLVPGNTRLAATAITDCLPLAGVRFEARHTVTESYLIDSASYSIHVVGTSTFATDEPTPA